MCSRTPPSLPVTLTLPSPGLERQTPSAPSTVTDPSPVVQRQLARRRRSRGCCRRPCAVRSGPFTCSMRIEPSPLRARTSASSRHRHDQLRAGGLMKPDPVSDSLRGLLDLDSIVLPSCDDLHFAARRPLPRRPALFDLDQHVRLVPRLDLDRAVEGRHVNVRCARYREPLFVAADLAWESRVTVQPRPARIGASKRAGRGNAFHTGDRRCGGVRRSPERGQIAILTRFSSQTAPVSAISATASLRRVTRPARRR